MNAHQCRRGRSDGGVYGVTPGTISPMLRTRVNADQHLPDPGRLLEAGRDVALRWCNEHEPVDGTAPGESMSPSAVTPAPPDTSRGVGLSSARRVSERWEVDARWTSRRVPPLTTHSSLPHRTSVRQRPIVSGIGGPDLQGARVRLHPDRERSLSENEDRSGVTTPLERIWSYPVAFPSPIPIDAR